MARPEHEPSDDLRRNVLAMSGFGLRQEDIALVTNLSIKTLCKHYKNELQRGKAVALAKVADTLYQQAISGNLTAAIFYLKSQGGWSERHQIEHSGPGGTPLGNNDYSRLSFKELQLLERLLSKVSESGEDDSSESS